MIAMALANDPDILIADEPTTALSPDGQMLAVVTPTSIELRDAVEGTLTRRLLGQTEGYGVAFPPPAPFFPLD